MVEAETILGRHQFQDLFRNSISAMLCDQLMASLYGLTPHWR